MLTYIYISSSLYQKEGFTENRVLLGLVIDWKMKDGFRMKNIQTAGCPAPHYNVTRSSTHLNPESRTHTDVLMQRVFSLYSVPPPRLVYAKLEQAN